MWTIILKRGLQKRDLVRTRRTWDEAFTCASALAELHGLKSSDIHEHQAERTFTLDASGFY
jgi:hypothetical protein